MIEFELNAKTKMFIEHLVVDFNGTLAVDGELIDGVEDLLQRLSECLQIHVLTADTHGTVKGKVSSISCFVHVIEAGEEDKQKAAYLSALGTGVAAIGNGRNDTDMLALATVGIAVLQTEGLSPKALQSADVLTKDIVDALNLLMKPKRLVATLRK